MKAPLKHVVSDTDRYGRVRHYVRLGGRKVRIRETPGTPAFLTAYTAVILGFQALRYAHYEGVKTAVGQR